MRPESESEKPGLSGGVGDLEAAEDGFAGDHRAERVRGEWEREGRAGGFEGGQSALPGLEVEVRPCAGRGGD